MLVSAPIRAKSVRQSALPFRRRSAHSAGRGERRHVQRAIAVLVGGGELGHRLDCIFLEPELAVAIKVEVELGKVLAPRDPLFLAGDRPVGVLGVAAKALFLTACSRATGGPARSSRPIGSSR